jgi:hypothetical protein
LNATFFRRDRNDIFIYPLLQFLDTVDNSGLGLSKIVPNDAHIPSDMINKSLTDVYKMVRGQIRNNYPQNNGVVWPWDKSHLDPSDQNWSR